MVIGLPCEIICAAAGAAPPIVAVCAIVCEEALSRYFPICDKLAETCFYYVSLWFDQCVANARNVLSNCLSSYP